MEKKEFNGKKLIEAIILTEEKIGDLYRNLANEVEDEKAKNLFIKLAQDEDRHKKIYSALLNKLPEVEVTELSDFDRQYIEALIDVNVVTNKEMEKRYSKFDALLLAEKIERDGIMLVEQLIFLYPSLAKEEIGIILKEEKSHLQSVLEREKNSQLRLLAL